MYLQGSFTCSRGSGSGGKHLSERTGQFSVKQCDVYDVYSKKRNHHFEVVVDPAQWSIKMCGLIYQVYQKIVVNNSEVSYPFYDDRSTR